jgi:hypothetical protein
MSKHERDCARICCAAGLTVLEIAYGRHLKIVCRQGTVICAKTPSDHRWAKNLQAVARRIANQN